MRATSVFWAVFPLATGLTVIGTCPVGAQTGSPPYKAATGPFAVGTVPEVVLHDAARNKDLPVFVSYPKGDGRFPVIIFSHGAMGSGDVGFPIVEHWTSHGYVVLCPTHADSIKLRRAQGKAGVGDTLSAIRESGRSGRWDDNWTARPRDVSFVLDSLNDLEAKVPALRGKLDRDRMAVGGHSLGAYTAQVAGGATVRMPGKAEPQSLRDPRLKAVLQLSGQGRGQQGLYERSWVGMKLPMMCVTGSLDRGAQGQQPGWRRDPFALSAPGGKYFLFIEGANHGSFTGKMAVGGLSGRRGGGSLLQRLSPEQRQRLIERFRGLRNGASADAGSAPGAGRRAGTVAEPASRGDQKAIFEWVKMATTAFWDSALKQDQDAKAWLQSDALAALSHGAVKLERR